MIICAAMAKISGTGIDAIEIGRVKQAIEDPRTGERFRARVFTPGEVAYCESRRRVKYQSYAARFAAKEATMKALGTGWNRNVRWNEIEVRREPGRPPQIALSGKAAEFARNLGVKRLHLSLTHSRKDAIAQVIAES
jgi:holo-[acyl-carrier protein] synthase